MEQEVLKKFEAAGLSSPFITLKSGEIFVTQTGEPLTNELSQVAIVIFETMAALTQSVKIEKFEIVGNKKGVLLALEEKRIVGSIFESAEGVPVDDLWRLLGELRDQSKTAVVPEVKPKVKLGPPALEEIRATLKEYLGDFAERTYQNQIKLQRFKPEEFYEDDLRRLIFALGKAAGMIIGPSKGGELTKKMLKALK